MMASLHNEKLSILCIVVTFITEVLFKQFLILTSQTQLTEKGNGYLSFKRYWGAQHHHIFHSGYFDYRHTFRTVVDSY